MGPSLFTERPEYLTGACTQETESIMAGKHSSLSFLSPIPLALSRGTSGLWSSQTETSSIQLAGVRSRTLQRGPVSQEWESGQSAQGGV